MSLGNKTRTTMARLQSISVQPMVRNAGWLMAGQGAAVGLQAVCFVSLAKLLGTTEYGVFAGAFAFTSVISWYAPMGTGTLFLRYVAGDREKHGPYFGNMLLWTISLGLLFIVGLTATANYALGAGSAKLVFLAAVANCLCGQLIVEIARVFQAFERMRTTAALHLGVNALRTLTVVAMLLFLHHASALQWAIASTVVSLMATVAAVVLAIREFGPPALDLALSKRHTAEGLGFSFAASTTSVYNDFDKAMLSHYQMNEQNGVYAMAYRAVDFATMPIQAMRDATLPRIFQKGRSGIIEGAEYGMCFVPRALALGATVSALLFATAPLIPHIVGRGFSESVIVLRWLAIIPMLRGIHQMTGVILTGSGYQPARTATQVLAAVLNFCLNVYMIPHFGWRGAAWSSVATDATLAAMNFTMLQFLLARARRQIDIT